MRRIAVDAMGSDEAPIPEVEGAVAALAKRGGDLAIILVGDQARITAALAGRAHPNLTIRHASQAIAMGDHPSVAVKSKKDSSMRVCFDLVKRGEAEAVVSAGNSGAMMACGLFVIKRLPGVERPGIVTVAPTVNGSHCVVLDVGANTEVKPVVLAQFGVLGAAYARLLLGKERPRVAVLSNGEERTKGTDLTREAHRMLARAGADSDFQFAGYAEGRDFFFGDFDVVVTDGFTGNIGLKTFEGAIRYVFDALKAEIGKSMRTKLGALLMKPAFRALKARIEPDEFGGAPLLGVNGAVIIGHGSASGRALQNAILSADRLVGAGVGPALVQSIAKHRALWATDEDRPPAAPAPSHAPAE